MATASNQDQLNEVVNLLIQEVDSERLKYTDLAKALMALDNIAQGESLGLAAGADTLDQIGVGEAAAVRVALSLKSLSLYSTIEAAVNAGQLGNAASVRAGIGFSSAALTEINKQGWGLNSGIQINNLDDTTYPTGVYFYNVSNGTTTGTPPPGETSGMVLIGANGSPGGYKSQIAIGRGSGKICWRYATSGGYGEWSYAYSTNNTTIDSNGFLKSASPIFRLANEAEYAFGDGFIADGCGAYNSEAEGVTASHDNIGFYTVSGSLGFADDGWTIEIPQDVNGNRLCFVETETADDGTITVRTFGRRFDYETAMIVAGDPVDIPDGRWIDLRLKMPATEPVDDSGASDEVSTEG
ncbi:hypothetical protein [Salinicola sp. CR57]|uniref:phage tail fiber protein n=1 Tax=Salinicola sp. CR57 TaxID=1949086 RepID=UPI001300204B|nr:hypothetical protein [Salinicola sp. CR57]